MPFSSSVTDPSDDTLSSYIASCMPATEQQIVKPSQSDSKKAKLAPNSILEAILMCKIKGFALKLVSEKLDFERNSTCFHFTGAHHSMKINKLIYL